MGSVAVQRQAAGTHSHVMVLASDFIHNLKSKLHSTLDQHIGNTFNMQSM